MTTSILEKTSDRPLVEKNVTISGVTWKQFKQIADNLKTTQVLS